MNRRVAVTGIGLVTPLGIGRQAFAKHLFDGVCGIRPIQGFDSAACHARLGGQVRDFIPTDFISDRSLRRMDRLSQMVVASATMALEDAGIDLGRIDRKRAGVVMGTAFGATDVAARFAGTLFTEGPRRVNPILVPNTVMNAPAGHTAIELGLQGINSTVNHREASAETALAYAAMQIRQNRADLLLAGGGDILSPFFLTVLERFRALSPQDNGEERSRPFDRHRNGPVAGEGAGLICIESLESARSRGASVYCELTGWGMGSAPAPANDWPDDPAGMVLAMKRATAMAGLQADRINAVSAAANGGIRSDRLEARALELFFNHHRRPVLTAVKGALGEGFASGGIRAAAMALSVQADIVPPVLGLCDPIVSLDAVQGSTRQVSVSHGLINACASGGTFAALVFSKPS